MQAGWSARSPALIRLKLMLCRKCGVDALLPAGRPANMRKPRKRVVCILFHLVCFPSESSSDADDARCLRNSVGYIMMQQHSCLGQVLCLNRSFAARQATEQRIRIVEEDAHGVATQCLSGGARTSYPHDFTFGGTAGPGHGPNRSARRPIYAIDVWSQRRW